MRYYCIVIGAGVSTTPVAILNGLVSDLTAGISIGALSPHRKGRSRKLSKITAGKLDFVSQNDYVSVNPGLPSFNDLVQSELNVPGKSLSVPVTLPAIPGAPMPGAQFTSVVDNQNDPGALDIEFDITCSPNGHLLSGWLKIWGIPQNIISQATNLNKNRIQIYAGFTNGLPIANFEMIHQGLIADGMILPCFGNWIGNELSLEFVINAGIGGPGGPTDPKNIIHNMPQGTTLGSAISSALTTAFPNYSISVNISDSLVLGNPDQGFHQSLEQYQNYVKNLSHSILGTPDTTGYQGVTMSSMGNNIYVTDGTKDGNNIPIQYIDLVGQPTWSPQGNNVLQIKTLLRADITPAGPGGNVTITLPPNLLLSTPRSAASMFLGGQILQYQPGDVLLFQGKWTVINVRHVGRFRQPTGESWVTIIDAVAPFSSAIGTSTWTSSGGLQTFKPDRPAGAEGEY